VPASTTHCGRKQQRGTEDRFRDSSLAVRRHLHCVHLEHLGHEVEYPGLRGIYASERVLAARLLTIGVEAELCSAQPWLLHRPSGQPGAVPVSWLGLNAEATLTARTATSACLLPASAT
jgi:hypothetical protein